DGGLGRGGAGAAAGAGAPDQPPPGAPAGHRDVPGRPAAPPGSWLSRMSAPGRLIGSGRCADVYDIGQGRVLRRYRDAAATAGREAEVMTHARAHGVPVPEVFDASGT